jgi:hypothetical protein
MNAGGDPCGIALSLGRYMLYVFAEIDSPVGAYNTLSSSQKLSSKMPFRECLVPNPDGSCKNGITVPVYPSNNTDGLGDSTWYRGQPNDIAMQLHLERFTGSGWTRVRSRSIPRGAFGTEVGGGWNKFALPLKADEIGLYRLVVSNKVNGIKVFPEWRYERNPEVTEFKVVT